MKTKSLFIFAVLVLLALTSAYAQAPQLLNYQGKLLQNGTAVSGAFNLTFSIYATETGGTVLWSETINNVTLDKGVFSVLLGKTTPLTSALFPGTEPRYVGIKIGSDPNELAPRFQLTSVAYALKASEAASVTDGAITAADIAIGHVVKSINSLKDNVTLNAGANVTITPSGNALTISASGTQLPDGSVTTAKLASNAVTSDKIADGQVGNADLANDAVTSSKIANDAVGSSEIASVAVGNSEIALDAVTGAEIRDNTVGASDIVDNMDFGSATSNGFVNTWSSISGRAVSLLSNNVAGGGFARVLNKDGNAAVVLSTRGGGAEGDMSVYRSDGTSVGGVRSVNGLGEVWVGANGSKPFYAPDPNMPGRLIKYTAIEGPEAAMYVRGQGELISGQARIGFPDHFKAMAVSSSITVTLTPRSRNSRGLAAENVSEEGIQVIELNGGTGNYTFDYVAYAVRKGYEDYKVYVDSVEILESRDKASPSPEPQAEVKKQK